VLDLGCGTGVVTIAAAARGFRVVGVDHSPEMLEIARRKVDDAGLADRVELEAGEADRLRFGAGEFDGVLCQGLLHHLPELGPCLDEVDRALKPGGFLYVSEPTRDATPLKRALLRLWRRPQAPEDESPRPSSWGTSTGSASATASSTSPTCLACTDTCRTPPGSSSRMRFPARGDAGRATSSSSTGGRARAAEPAAGLTAGLRAYLLA
jgi:SAM-dependent methyltransferase